MNFNKELAIVILVVMTVILASACFYMLGIHNRSVAMDDLYKANQQLMVMKIRTEQFLRSQPEQTRAVFRQFGFQVPQEIQGELREN